MKITYVGLRGFKRFPLSNIEFFEHNFASKLVAITGQNGAGKSSLLKELSPLPGSKDNFKVGGRKEIRLEKNESCYVLVSDFTNGAKYSFVKDGVELNQAGLVTAQKDLVNSHFNLTEEIFGILTGETPFTALTPIQRKKLLTNLTKVNIEKLLDGFNHYSDELKTLEGMLKSLNVAYSAELNKMRSDEQQQLDIAEKEGLTETIQLLLEMRSELKPSLPNGRSQHKVTEAMQRLNQTDESLRRFKGKHYRLLSCYPASALEAMDRDLNVRLAKLDKHLEMGYAHIEALQKSHREIRQRGEVSSGELEAKLEGLSETKDKLCRSLVYLQPNHVSAKERYAAHRALKTHLVGVIDELSADLAETFDSSHLTQASERIEVIQGQILPRLHRELDRVNQLLELSGGISKEGLKVDCPSCGAEFTPVVSHGCLSGLNKQVAKINEEIDRVNETLRSSKETLAELQGHQARIDQLYYYRRCSKHCPEFWSLVDKNEWLPKLPHRLLGLLDKFDDDFAVLGSLEQLEDTAKEVSRQLSLVNKTGTQSLFDIEQEIALLETTELNPLLLEKQNVVLPELKAVSLSKNLHAKLSELETGLSKAAKEQNELNLNHVKETVIDQIDKELMQLRLRLQELDASIRENDKLHAVIDNYQKEIAKVRTDITLITGIKNELSPKNGLIARLVGNFLNSIIDYVNTIVGSIMEYKLSLSLIDIAENVLDYRFRFNVDDALAVNDVSLASSGMREVIDFSFKLAFYKLLKLENYPLYLDEFGIRLDPQHKNKIHSLIFKFIASDMFSQIFLITHTDTGFLGHREAESIVIK